MSSGSADSEGTASAPKRPALLPRFRELAALLLLAIAGAGLVFLATRQTWARVVIAVPRPLPAAVVPETGQALVPAAEALAAAALASLAAVLATRGLARRITGVLLAGLGAGIAAALLTGVTASSVLAAAAAAASGGPGGSAAGGTGAGSVTAGAPSGSVPVGSFAGHVVFSAFPWRGLAVFGALVVLAAGLLVAWRAPLLPGMSSRFDRPAGAARARAVPRRPAGRLAAAAPPADQGSAAVWEALTRGEDPTAGPAAGRPGG